MFFSKIKYSEKFDSYNKSIDEDNDFYHLIIETAEDVQDYFDVFTEIHQRRVWDIWKSQKENWRPFDHMPNTPEHTLAWVLAQRITAEKHRLSLVDFCDGMDNIQVQRYLTMLRLVAEGNTLRINAAGGYSPLSDVFVLSGTKVEYQDKNQLNGWLLNKDFNLNEPIIEIDSKILILENDSTLPYQFTKWIESKLGKEYYKSNDITILKEFYLKTREYDNSQWYTFFNTALNNGLTDVYAYTTLNNKDQVLQIKRIIKKFPDSKLKIHLILTDTEAYRRTDDMFKGVNVQKYLISES